MTANPLFSASVILFKQQAKTREEALQLIAGEFLAKGVVTDAFAPALLKREATYPTGLALGSGIGVAIPHTDADKVLEDQLGFLSLSEPVEFRQMGSETDTVPVSIIIPLALKTAHAQLDMLQKLMALFGDDDQMKQLAKIDDVDTLVQLFTTNGIK